MKKERKGLDEIDTRSYRLRWRLRLRLRKEKKRDWGRVRRGGPMLISSALFYIRKKTYLVM